MLQMHSRLSDFIFARHRTQAGISLSASIGERARVRCRTPFTFEQSPGAAGKSPLTFRNAGPRIPNCRGANGRAIKEKGPDFHPAHENKIRSAFDHSSQRSTINFRPTHSNCTLRFTTRANLKRHTIPRGVCRGVSLPVKNSSVP